MGETELREIEARLQDYPPQARHDILMLTRELRRVSEATDRRRAEQATSPLYDPLTGLLNAGAYGVRFAMARARATRFRKIFAVMSIDLKGNTGIGQGAPERDRTVRAVAERLESLVRATDTLARIGDENFAVILEDLTQPDHAERVKQTVQDALGEPIQIGMQDFIPETDVQLQFYPTGQSDRPTFYNA